MNSVPSNAEQIVGLKVAITTNKYGEQTLGIRAQLLHSRHFLFGWPAARAFQYRNRLEQAFIPVPPPSIPTPLPVDLKEFQSCSDAMPSLDAEEIFLTGNMHLAQVSGVQVVDQCGIVFSLKLENADEAELLLSPSATQEFIRLVNVAKKDGLKDPDDRPTRV